MHSHQPRSAGHKSLSIWVKLVYIVLLLNGLPAFLILNSVPHLTDQWFVWTVKPDASARLLGVMYANALLLVAAGFFQSDWPRARITLVVIAFFSTAATIITLAHLDPFLKHPWFHLAYWLTNYLLLFVAAPLTFFWQERKFGGKLRVEDPLGSLGRGVALASLIACGLTGAGLLIDPALVSNFWPWNLTPLVGRILGVWFFALALAYGWALWDGDWRRVRLIFWQAGPTAILMLLVPLLHSPDIGPGRPALPVLNSNAAITLYLGLALLSGILNLLVCWLQHTGRLSLVTTGAGQPRNK